jgi:membrane-associated protease RseP (regulator of RpoE activity)
MPDGSFPDPQQQDYRESSGYGRGSMEDVTGPALPVSPREGDLPVPAERGVESPPRRVKRDRPLVNLVLLGLTLLTTTLAGMGHYAGFIVDFRQDVALPGAATLFLGGFWYSLTILAILGAHELGHYFACRYYRVDASLPYFLPVPLLLTGTLGAFIRIRQPVYSKRTLFDIGVAGPFAGFVVAVPALVAGIWMSRIVSIPPDFEGFWLGEPLLYKASAWLIWGTPPEGYDLNMHPMAFAAWFGMIATALNLFPIGQLDGGHVSYAVLGRGSSLVTLGTVAVAIGLAFFSMSWIFWTVLMVVMLIVFGPHHPRTVDEDVPIGRGRMILAAIAALIFICCFTPAPIEPLQLLEQSSTTAAQIAGPTAAVP